MNSLSGFASAEHTPVAVFEKMLADGAICAKTTFERGFGGKDNLPVPITQIILYLVAVSHARGIPVMLHANSQAA